LRKSIVDIATGQRVDETGHPLLAKGAATDGHSNSGLKPALRKNAGVVFEHIARDFDISDLQRVIVGPMRGLT